LLIDDWRQMALCNGYSNESCIKIMTCPACNYELVAHDEHCENCGAPTYLASAVQAVEEAHCTYCGTRDEADSDFCHSCGLKKDCKANEIVIGTCRNCGTAWRNIWLYCQTCGFARENGLVETLSPMSVGVSLAEPVSLGRRPLRPSVEPFLPYSPATVWHAEPSLPASEDNYLDENSHLTEPQSVMSENEVVERMFVNGGDPVKNSNPEGAINARSFLSQERQEDGDETSASLTYSATSPTADESLASVPGLAPAAPLPALETSSKKSAPVQAVRFLEHAPVGNIDNKQTIKIILVLMALFLIF
jgi:hypothetical protein